MVRPHGDTLRNKAVESSSFNNVRGTGKRDAAKTAPELIGTAPKSVATSRVIPPSSYTISVYPVAHVEVLRVSCSSFQSSVCPSTVVHLQPTTVDTHHVSSCPRAKKISAPYFGSNALWLSSNPRGSVLELVEPLSEHLDESGAVRISCCDKKYLADQMLETRVTNTEKPTAKSAMDEKAARDLMEKLANWKKKQQECKPH